MDIQIYEGLIQSVITEWFDISYFIYRIHGSSWRLSCAKYMVENLLRITNKIIEYILYTSKRIKIELEQITIEESKTRLKKY